MARITVGRQDAKRVEHVRNADGRLLCCTCVLQMSLVSYTQPMSIAVGSEAYRSPTGVKCYSLPRNEGKNCMLAGRYRMFVQNPINGSKM